MMSAFNAACLSLFLLPSLASAAVSETPDWSVSGGEPDQQLGTSAAGGDLNGDGFSDILVGAPEAGGRTGQVHVYFGSESGPPSAPSLTLSGDAPGDRFGFSVTGGGDLNGDGYDDLVVGARNALDDVGVVTVYPGSPDGPDGAPSITLAGDAELFVFGWVVAGAGDIEGDGFDDLLVLSWGALFVYPGSADGPNEDAALVIELDDSRGVGTDTVAGAGDVNGDGFDDVILGSLSGEDGSGLVSVYLGSARGLVEPPAIQWSTPGFSGIGVPVAGVGDVNGDGYADVAFGSSDSDSGTGRVYVSPGSPDGTLLTGSVELGVEAGNPTLGFSIAGVGDVDGDGYDDVLVGAPATWSVGGFAPAEGEGYAALYPGSADGVLVEAANTLVSGEEYDLFGYPVAGAGDVNGDGLMDALVGAPRSGDGAGRVSLYPGQGADPDSGDEDAAETPKTTPGCGCVTGERGGPSASVLLLIVALARRRAGV